MRRKASVRWTVTPDVTRGALVVAALLVAPIAAVVLAGCGSGGGEARPLVFRQSDDGRTAVAAVGDVILLNLVENPSTGYTWQVDLSAGLRQRADRYIEPSPAPGVVGAAGTREITIVVQAPGVQTIRGVYVRPWEDESRPAEKTFSLTLQVR